MSSSRDLYSQLAKSGSNLSDDDDATISPDELATYRNKSKLPFCADLSTETSESEASTGSLHASTNTNESSINDSQPISSFSIITSRSSRTRGLSSTHSQSSCDSARRAFLRAALRALRRSNSLSLDGFDILQCSEENQQANTSEQSQESSAALTQGFGLFASLDADSITVSASGLFNSSADTSCEY